jgi:hypothetical protein
MKQELIAKAEVDIAAAARLLPGWRISSRRPAGRVAWTSAEHSRRRSAKPAARQGEGEGDHDHLQDGHPPDVEDRDARHRGGIAPPPGRERLELDEDGGEGAGGGEEGDPPGAQALEPAPAPRSERHRAVEDGEDRHVPERRQEALPPPGPVLEALVERHLEHLPGVVEPEAAAGPDRSYPQGCARSIHPVQIRDSGLPGCKR